MNTAVTKNECGVSVNGKHDRKDTFKPRFDIWEGEDKLVLQGDLPGVTHEDLNIEIEGNELSIHGAVAKRHEGKYLLREYGVGDFHRKFTIGEAIDAEKISAELKDGVLTLHLPKLEKVKPRRIKVNAG